MAKRLYRLFPALYPAPALLVTSTSPDGSFNVMTASWAGMVSSAPPQVAVALRPYRLSCQTIRRTGEFVINCPTEELLLAVDRCGMLSGRAVDKLQATGLTPEPAQHVKAPLIRECPVSLECRVAHSLHLDSHELFVGVVLAVQVDEAILTADGQIDYDRVRAIAVLGNEYRRIGERLHTAGFSLSEDGPATPAHPQEASHGPLR